MSRSAPLPILFSALVALLCILPSTPVFAWGPDGHRIVNRLAAETLPAGVPEFLRSRAAIDEIEYLGPEPDRWRSANEPELNAAQAAEHYIDLELADTMGKLPRRRYDFIAALYAAGLSHPDQARDLRPEKVGLQPWVANEVYERLQAALREYREQAARHEDTKAVEAAATFYAGWLGHYVGDGAMPLHTTVNYNGWAEKENPNQYVTSPGIHSAWESAFVRQNIKAADVEPLMTPVQTLHDPFDDYLAYLRASHALVERVYQLEKAHGFERAGTVESRQFTAARLAAGASELRDMIVTAWEQSARPAPPYREPAPVPRSTVPRAAQY
ncbi:MAG: S1/P1 nuclease [Acidobacteriaceae bacterium]